MSKNKPLSYTLHKRSRGVGKNKNEVVIQARPTGRQRISFENFCELVAKNTTLNYMEVATVLNLSADTARFLVANGDIVEFGRLGTLSPSFKSKVVPEGTEFNANIHITEPKINLRADSTYFKLRPEEVSYERVEPKKKKPKKSKEQGDKPGGSDSGGSEGNDSGNSGGSTPDTGGHAGI